MKFTKLAKSDKFEYMMLSRLIQDAKYFIEHPDLKHLWARTLDEHINKMLEQYTKLDPKPEWTSEDEIYELADKMKESYKNHWNEVHPDNKIEANNYYKVNDNFKINDNFKVGDKVFFDTLYEFQEEDLGFNYDRGILKEIKHWPSNNREYYIVQTDDGKLLQVGNVFHTEEEKDAFTNNWMNPKFEKESAIQQPNKPKPTTMLPDNMQWAWDPDAADWVAVLKDNDNTTPPLYDPNNQNVVNQNTTSYMSNIKSASCLAEFLDGPRYSKEIKIEAGLIKNGLVKYAGFDFNRGTKYAITTKGLEVLRRASEAEHNEALNEREKLAYLFGFNTDKVSTLDTTGKVIKSEEITDEQLEESWNKYYPLYLKDAEEEKITEANYPEDDEVAQNLKLMLKGHLKSIQRYKRAIPLMKRHTENKMKKIVELGRSRGLSEDEITKQVDQAAEEYYKKENKIKPTFNSLSEDYLKEFIFNYIKNKKSASLNKFAKKWTICEADGTPLGKVTASSELDAKVKFGIEHPEYADSQSISAKEIKSELEYGGSFEYNDYKIDLLNDADGGATFVIYAPEGKTVNHESMYKGTASTMDEAITKAYNIIDGSKEINAQYEQTTEQHLDYPNPSETPTTDVILENHDGWVNTAAKDKPKVTPEFAKLHALLCKYANESLIQVFELDGNLVATGDPQVINNLEHQVKDIGYHCEAVSEYTDSDYAETYSLKIFMK